MAQNINGRALSFVPVKAKTKPDDQVRFNGLFTLSETENDFCSEAGEMAKSRQCITFQCENTIIQCEWTFMYCVCNEEISTKASVIAYYPPIIRRIACIKNK